VPPCATSCRTLFDESDGPFRPRTRNHPPAGTSRDGPRARPPRRRIARWAIPGVVHSSGCDDTNRLLTSEPSRHNAVGQRHDLPEGFLHALFVGWSSPAAALARWRCRRMCAPCRARRGGKRTEAASTQSLGSSAAGTPRTVFGHLTGRGICHSPNVVDKRTAQNALASSTPSRCCLPVDVPT
jgi:hypothetical protein